MRVPRRLQELRLDLAKAGDELAQQLDRAPTVGELAERLGITDDEVVEGMAASNAYTASSLDAQPEEDDTEGALADRIGYEDHGLEGIEYVESLKPLIAELPPRDRKILSLRFVANMTQSRDRRGARHLADACLPAAVPHAGPAAQGPDGRGVSRGVSGSGRGHVWAAAAAPSVVVPRRQTSATSGTPGR